MAEKKIQLRIITPTTVKVEEAADMVIMRGIDGDIGIMPDHVACSIVLDYGILRILNGSTERKLAVLGGLAEMKNNTLTVTTRDAHWPDEIDVARAQAARERAERRFQEKKDGLEIERNQLQLRRALVRIEISSYAVLNPGWKE